MLPEHELRQREPCSDEPELGRPPGSACMQGSRGSASSGDPANGLDHVQAVCRVTGAGARTGRSREVTPSFLHGRVLYDPVALTYPAGSMACWIYQSDRASTAHWNAR